MTLKELVEYTPWPTILVSFRAIYPEAANNLDGYGLVFEKLKELEPEKPDYWILLESVRTEDEAFVDVSGLRKNPKIEEDKYPQGLELSPWREWLGMEIHPETLKCFSTTEILVHCLYEMTYAGFTESTIQKRSHSMEKSGKKRDRNSYGGQDSK